MSTRPLESTIEPNDWRERVASAKTAREILTVLQESGFPLKPASKAILEAADQAIKQGRAKLQIDGREAELHFRSIQADSEGDELEVRLKLIEAGYDGQIHQVNMATDELLPDEKALLSLHFTDDDGEVEVDTFVMTQQAAEGKGFGVGIGLLINVVIQHMIEQKEYFRKAKMFTAIIHDKAESQDWKHDRSGWSSVGARLLGYTLVSDEDDDMPEFERVFRV